MAGRRFAILVGNAVFPLDPSNLPTLRCSGNDVKTLGELLAAERHGSYQITPIIDGTHDVGRRASYKCLRDATKEDLVLIYYSGHGKLDEEGNLYLATRDTLTDELPPTSIAVEDIRKYMRESNAGSIVVILDCCYSGSVKKMYKGAVSDQAIQAMRGLEGEGKFFLTAGTDTQLAVENQTDENSLLTKFIIEGIRTGKADRDEDGKVSFQELCSYVQKEVSVEGKQKPKAWFLDSAGDVTVALTGLEPFTSKRKAVIKKLYEMASRDFLDGHAVVELLNIINSTTNEVARRLKTKEWIDEFHSKLISDGEFVQEVHRRIAEMRISCAPPIESQSKLVTRVEESHSPPTASTKTTASFAGAPLAVETTEDSFPVRPSLFKRFQKRRTFILLTPLVFGLIVAGAIKGFHYSQRVWPYVPSDAFWTGDWEQGKDQNNGPGKVSLQMRRGPGGFEGLLKYERTTPPCVLNANLDFADSDDSITLLFRSNKVEAVGACPEIRSSDGSLTGQITKANVGEANPLWTNLYIQNLASTSEYYFLTKQ